MTIQFSRSTQEWLHKQDVLVAAEDRFWREWAAMLKEVQRHFSGKTWQCRLYGDPPDMLQMLRHYWPDAIDQVHLEVLCNREALRRDIAHVDLHIEHSFPQQTAVCGCLRELLRPHSVKIREALGPFVPELPVEPPRDVVRAQLCLNEATSEKICAALECLGQLDTFVDEAIALRDTAIVWRTDFSPQNSNVFPRWFDNLGKQEAVSGVGRFAGPAWRIDGREPNARRDISWEEGTYLFLRMDDHSGLIRNDEEYVLLIVAKSELGGRLSVWADAHHLGPDGQPDCYPVAFVWDCEMPASDRWQCLTTRVRVPPVDKVTAVLPREKEPSYRRVPCPCDFSKEGIWIVLNVQTDDPNFLIDTLKIARAGSA